MEIEKVEIESNNRARRIRATNKMKGNKMNAEKSNLETAATRAGKCPNCGEVHAPGVLDAAAVIMDGRIKLSTAFGQKTICGVANLIENETHAGELLAALESIVNDLALTPEISKTRFAWRTNEIARAAIRNAKGQEPGQEHQCDNCGRIYPWNALQIVKRISERVDEDGPMPSGECPHCGALCYPLSVAN